MSTRKELNIGNVEKKQDGNVLLYDLHGEVLKMKKPDQHGDFSVKLSGKTKTGVSIDGPIEVITRQEAVQPPIPILYDTDRKPLLYKSNANAVSKSKETSIDNSTKIDEQAPKKEAAVVHQVLKTDSMQELEGKADEVIRLKEESDRANKLAIERSIQEKATENQRRVDRQAEVAKDRADRKQFNNGLEQKEINRTTLKPENANAQAKKLLESTPEVKIATEIIDRIAREKEERLRQELNKGKTEPATQPVPTEGPKVVEKTAPVVETPSAEAKEVEAFKKRVSDRAYYARLGKEPSHDLDVAAWLEAEQFERNLLKQHEAVTKTVKVAVPAEVTPKVGMWKVVKTGDLLERMEKEGQLTKTDKTKGEAVLKEPRFTGEYFEKDGRIWGRAEGKNIWYPLEKVRLNEEAIKRDQEYRDNVRTKDVPGEKAERKEVEAPRPKTIDKLRQELGQTIKEAQEKAQKIAQQIAQMEQPGTKDKAENEVKIDKDSAERNIIAEKEEKRRKLECKEKLDAAEKKGREQGEKDGREKLLAEIKDKKSKNIFRRFGNFIKRHKKVIIAGVVGAAVVFATWVTIHALSLYLPFNLPIREVNNFINGVRIP